MKIFKNKKTGVISYVKSKDLIEQYEKHSERYVEVKEKTTKED